jgi:hypothetical protein
VAPLVEKGTSIEIYRFCKARFVAGPYGMIKGVYVAPNDFWIELESGLGGRNDDGTVVSQGLT